VRLGLLVAASAGWSRGRVARVGDEAFCLAPQPFLIPRDHGLRGSNLFIDSGGVASTSTVIALAMSIT